MRELDYNASEVRPVVPPSLLLEVLCPAIMTAYLKLIYITMRKTICKSKETRNAIKPSINNTYIIDTRIKNHKV